METGIVKRNTLPTRHEIEDRENRRKAWLHEKKSIMENKKKHTTSLLLLLSGWHFLHISR